MTESPVSHAWDPITDLPDDWSDLARPDLDDMLRLWEDERHSLRDKVKIERLTERLATLWAIETGVIERLYTIDRGTTETLVDLGLEAVQRFSSAGRLSPEAARLIADQRAALDFVFTYLKDERPLSTSYLKELHQLLLRNQDWTEASDFLGHRFKTPILKGEWKKLSNNPLTPDGSIHEYCPPEFVQDDMDALLRMHHEHLAKGVRPEVEAAWLHHRFAQIHPFQDGNGRVARALATMVFLKAGFLPLVIRGEDHRETYLDALETADKGDLSSLVNLFANIQTKDLEDAITYVRGMRGEGLRSIAASAAEATKRRIQTEERQVEDITQTLIGVAENRLKEVAYELRDVFGKAGIELSADVIRNTTENQGWWAHQVINAAQTYHYFADMGRSRHWVQLRLGVPSINVPRWHVVVSFHHKESRAGLMAAVVFLTTSEAGLEDPRPVILGSPHEFTYSSTTSSPESEFRTWFEEAIRAVLETWQSRI